MSLTSPVHARVLPVGPNTNDPDNFDAQADALVAELRPFSGELNDLSDNVYANALDASSRAADAIQKAGEAAGSAAAAANHVVTAGTLAGIAGTKAAEAADSATAAANNVAALKSTSVTDNTVGLGVMNFVTQAGKAYQAGTDVKAVDQTNSANAVYGPVVSYSGTNLQIKVTSYDGAGLVTDWNISVSGQRGAKGDKGDTGGVNGGSLTGALNTLLSGSVATSASPNVWGVGNIVPMTGSVGVNNFTAAPQPGAERTLVVVDGFPLANNANITVFGGDATLIPGDEVDLLALTTTTFRAIVRRKDGTATIAPPVYPSPRNQKLITSTGLFYPPITGWYRITVGGSGGRGGRAYDTCARATGGGGPGKAVKWFYLIFGTGYLFSIAAGVPNANANSSSNGADGFATTFTGPGGVTITGNGGKAGSFSTAMNVTLLGGLGGTGVGGDINTTGGRGGNITVTGNSGTNSVLATGAGSFGAFDVGYNGGDISISSSVNANVITFATGGAGVGGDGGSINLTQTFTPGENYRGATGSGGAGGAGVSFTTIVNNVTKLTAGGLNAGYEASSAQVNYITALLGATAGGVIAKNNSGANPDGAPGSGGAAQLGLTSAMPTSIAGYLAGGGGINVSIPEVTHTGEGSRFGGASGGFTTPPGGANPNGAVKEGFGMAEW